MPRRIGVRTTEGTFPRICAERSDRDGHPLGLPRQLHALLAGSSTQRERAETNDTIGRKPYEHSQEARCLLRHWPSREHHAMLSLRLRGHH